MEDVKPDGELLQNLRDAYVAAKLCDTVKCAELLETCLAVVKPAKERKAK
jgi:hypothetical protein